MWKTHLTWASICAGILLAGVVCYYPAMEAALDAQKRASDAERKNLEIAMQVNLETMDSVYQQGNDLRIIAGLKRENSLYETLLQSLPQEMVQTTYNLELAGVGGGCDGVQEQFIIRVLEPVPGMTTTNAAVQEQVEGMGATEVAYVNYLDWERLGNAVVMFSAFPDVTFVLQPDSYEIVRRGEIGIVVWKSENKEKASAYQNRWALDGFDTTGVVYSEKSVLKD